MLGFGKGPEVLVTREVEEALLDGIIGQNAGDESWIISPYTTIDKLGARCNLTAPMHSSVRNSARSVSASGEASGQSKN